MHLAFQILIVSFSVVCWCMLKLKGVPLRFCSSLSFIIMLGLSFTILNIAEAALLSFCYLINPNTFFLPMIQDSLENVAHITI